MNEFYNIKQPQIKKDSYISQDNSNEEEWENYFYDNQVIFKGITKINSNYCYIAFSIRTYKNAIQQANAISLTDLPVNKIISKSSIINFANLNYLSSHSEIIKLYQNLNADLNTKFYEKTQFKTFIQLTIIDLSSASNWYDFCYISWEILMKIFWVFQSERSYKRTQTANMTLNNLIYTNKLNEQLGVFIMIFIEKFCSIDKGSFKFNYNLNKNEIITTIFKKLYSKFDYLTTHRHISKNNINNNYYSIKYKYKDFYTHYLSQIHFSYYNLYFKKRKYYIEEKVTISSSGIESRKKKIKKEKIELQPQSFNIFLTIGKNNYNIQIVLYKEKVKIVNDEENIKNYLVNKKEKFVLFLQFRQIISSNLLHYKITKERTINNIMSIYENNNEKLLKTYLKSLIHIEDSPYNKKVCLDFGYNKFSLQTRSYSKVESDLLQKISLILMYKANDKLKNICDNIKFKQSFKKCYINQEKNKYIYNFQIFEERIYHKKEQSQSSESERDDEYKRRNNLYSFIFGNIKISKTEMRMNEIYKQSNDYNYKPECYYIYFIDIYEPKTASHVNFILSSRHLNEVLKKIKNQTIHAKYMISYQEMIDFLPRKISIRNEEGGRKVVLNFTKYKKLRMDWKKQLENKAKSYIPNPFKDKFSSMDSNKKKFEIKIFLKTNFINITRKSSLYDITTNESELIIQTVKIYNINNKNYTSIVRIYYHHILEYWSLIIFFPHNARKFISVIEPREVINIVQSQNFIDMEVMEEGNINEKEIWKYVIRSSRISSNFQNNSYFEVFTTKLLLKELLYYGYEIISDGIDDELNRVIYIEITLKTQILFMLEPIDKIIKKVEIDTTHLIFQTYSFHDLSWHKENFKLEDFESFFKDQIIHDKREFKLKELSKEEQILNEEENKHKSEIVLRPKIVEKAKIVERKFFPFSLLRKIIIPIIQPYVNNQTHFFEKQIISFENKGIEGENLEGLIQNIKYDRAHKKAIAKIYKQKIENQILFHKIYSEYISYNPPILASIGLNLVKENVIISLFYPYKTNSFDITLDFESIKQLFFPYFNDILIIDKLELGKRIMRRYEDFIRKSPQFLKLLKE